MKLIDILPYIDMMIDVRIFVVDVKTQNYEIEFEGMPDNIPYYLTQYELISADENDGSEAICPYKDKQNIACLRITLKV